MPDGFRRLGSRPAAIPAPPGERVVVVGAGIAGLAAAFRLQEAGFDVLVLEAADHVGGRMATIERDGYHIDVAASSVASSYREMVRLIHDAGLTADVDTSATTIGIVRNGRIHRFRQGSNLAALGCPFLSPAGKLQAARLGVDITRSWRAIATHDYVTLSQLDTETAAAYARRRLGDECLEYLVEIASEGWFAAPPEQVSATALLWHLKNFFLGRPFNSRRGIGFLAEGLARQLPVRLGARVTKVEETKGGVTVHWEGPTGEGVEDGSAAVIALPANQMSEIHAGLDPERRALVNALRYTRSIHVNLGLAAIPPEPSLYVMVPRKEHDSLVGVVFEHHKGDRAPGRQGLLSVYFRSPCQDRLWNLDDDKVVTAATDGLDAFAPGISSMVQWTNVQRLSPCVLEARPGVFSTAVRFDAGSDPSSRIQLAGDYLPLSSTNACLASGERAAERVAQRVGSRIRGSQYRRASG